MQPMNSYSSLHSPTLQRSRLIKLSHCAVVFDCFTWVTKATSKWNHWMVGWKDGYFNSQELSASLASSFFLKPVLAQWASWWSCWLDFYLKGPICTRHCDKRAHACHCIVSANPVIQDSFNRFYVIVNSVGKEKGKCCSQAHLTSFLHHAVNSADMHCYFSVALLP